MIIKNVHVVFFFTLTILVGCKTTKENIMVASIDHTLLDTLYIAAPKLIKKDSFSLPLYRPSATKYWDLIHTDLDLRFDWEKELVHGKATIVLSPHFYKQQNLILDAVNFEIKKVSMDNTPLEYDYDNNTLDVHLKKVVETTDQITLSIEYIAYPGFYDKSPNNRLSSEDKGLYFINPKGGTIAPRQIWTQGETSYNSRWFPTIDESNQRLSQKTSITVVDSLETLSNGSLISSIKNQDGTRTDTWSQHLKHAPYLFMVAVGDFEVVKEKWNDKELLYYVEPQYKNDATTIFEHTGEMMTFFSDILGFPYPWDKYAQIVVRDFVAGAMENTSAVTFSQSVQKTKKALIDDGNDAIVAHELFHHWFGNIVTCESWSNLTLNEGFANYSEYLWFEHKYGLDRADHHRLQELNGYLHSVVQQGTHPLIHYQYDDKEDMFDAHSYNKGGLVLHMLRHYIGDNAFFAGLNKYLIDNQYSEVEADELRMAFEDVTGEDLNWFFDQWYFSEGHPELYVSYLVDSLNQVLHVTVEQTQDPQKFPPIFVLPTDLAIYQTDGSISYVPLLINRRIQNFEIAINKNFVCAIFDGHKRLLAEIVEEKSFEESLHILASRAVNYVDRKDVLYSLPKEIPDHLVLEKLEDPYYHIRVLAIDKTTASHFDVLKELSLNDPHSLVRATAVDKIVQLGLNEKFDLFKKVIHSDPAYPPVGSALLALYQVDQGQAVAIAKTLIEPHPSPLDELLLNIFCAEDNVDQFDFLIKKLKNADGYELYGINDPLLSFFIRQNDSLLLRAATAYFSIASNLALPSYQKLLATKSIFILRSHLQTKKLNEAVNKISKMIDQILSLEKDQELLRQYRLF